MLEGFQDFIGYFIQTYFLASLMLMLSNSEMEAEF